MNNTIKHWSWLVLAITTTACASVHAPKGSVPKREQLLYDAFGGHMTLQVQQSSAMIVVESGELIAVAPDTIYLMTGGKVKAYDKSIILSGRIVVFNTAANSYASWTALLSIGTISNGVYALGTFPLTLITGIATTSAESKRKNYFDYPVETWEFIRRYARFPQGLPHGIPISALTPRPVGYKYK